MEGTEGWRRVTTRDELEAGDGVRRISFGTDDAGIPELALVGLDAAGQLFAYRNLCRHLPIPLDSGTGTFLDDEGLHLVCVTHGATYRTEDGLCDGGPCKGTRLQRYDVREVDGAIWILPPR